MTELLELKEKIKSFYGHNEAFILPVVKLLLAILTFSMVNSRLGYMTRIDSVTIVLVAALVCSFLPAGMIALFAALFSLLHMYALSLETVLVGLVVYLLVFLVCIRFSQKESVVIVITAILCAIKLPYVVPVVMGLIGTPASAVAVACGVVVYYLFLTISGSASAIASMGDSEFTAKIRLLLDGLLDNRSMLVLAAAFAVTVVVVYLVRRLSVDHAWTIAIVAGIMVNLIILLVGDLIYSTNLSIVSAVLGSLVAVIAGKVIEFFRFCVDYSRTEKVQFEDDEYYYYVKAVPKMVVAASTKTVKRINSSRRTYAPAPQEQYYGDDWEMETMDATEEIPPVREPHGAAGPQRRPVAGKTVGRAAERVVTTERTGARQGKMPAYGRSVAGERREHLSGARSMTIGTEQMTESPSDDTGSLM